jgi:hypothetical protein
VIRRADVDPQKPSWIAISILTEELRLAYLDCAAIVDKNNQWYDEQARRITKLNADIEALVAQEQKDKK